MKKRMMLITANTFPLCWEARARSCVDMSIQVENESRLLRLISTFAVRQQLLAAVVIITARKEILQRLKSPYREEVGDGWSG